MAAEIRVPALGESVTEATVGRWLKQEGETIASGQPLVELETEKVNLEVTAERDGKLEKILRKTGETVRIDEVLGTLTDSGPAESASPPAPADSSSAAPPAQRESAPEAHPEPASTPQPAATQQPASPPQPTTQQPASIQQPASAPQSASIQQPAPAPQPTAQQHPATVPPGQPPPSSPAARQMAAEGSLDLGRVAGSGPGGRITLEDVQTARRPASDATPQGIEDQGPRIEAPEESGSRREERLRLSRRRLTIARRLLEAQQTAAILTTFNEVDMGAVIEIRKRRKEAFQERHSVGLGFMSFFTKAVIGGLKAFPNLNAELQGEELILKHYYDIGIAVAAPEGLVVPVLRDADRKSFAEIERDIAGMAKRARENNLSLPELIGGTFTITNGGVFGSLLSTPILNPPQVGILGMHKIQERPVALHGEIVIRPMMYVALSYDHRVVDGREAVLFLGRLKELLEDPETLLLEG